MKVLRVILLVAGLALLVQSCSVTRRIPQDYPVLDSQYTSSRDGKLVSVTYPTSIPGPKERRMYVYLPREYSQDGEKYPVLYMLHGARGDEASWITQGEILPVIDSLFLKENVTPVLVVFPNMNSYDSEEDFAKSRHKGGIEAFFEVDGAVETSFMNDVVGAVDSLFRTIPDKDHRAIAGLSLGGMQALYISASAPDSFGYVGILSAPLHSALRRGPYSSFYDNVYEKIDRQFSNPPYVYNIYVGKKDIYKSTMEKFRNELDKRNYNCRLVLDYGGHQWPQWRSFAVDFIVSISEKGKF